MDSSGCNAAAAKKKKSWRFPANDAGFVRAVQPSVRPKQRRIWCRMCALGLKDPKPGSVSFTQRWGSACNLNPHLHILCPDGVYTTLRGFFKDVITQLKRDLTGFWVAHPDFVRLGIAIVAAWHRHDRGESTPLLRLVDEMLLPQYRAEVQRIIQGPDIDGLDKNDPKYVRSLLVADILATVCRWILSSREISESLRPALIRARTFSN